MAACFPNYPPCRAGDRPQRPMSAQGPAGSLSSPGVADWDYRTVKKLWECFERRPNQAKHSGGLGPCPSSNLNSTHFIGIVALAIMEKAIGV